MTARRDFVAQELARMREPITLHGTPEEAAARLKRMAEATDRMVAQDPRPLAERLRLNER